MGAVPGWPGADGFPAQPSVGQTRAMLERYAESGGTFGEAGRGPEHPTPPECWKAQWDACERFLRTGVPAGKITVPTWVVRGTEDRVVPYENAELVRRRIRQAEVVTMTGSGHVLAGAPGRGEPPASRRPCPLGSRPDWGAPPLGWDTGQECPNR